MRWRILRTLLHKELLRHLANRGGLVLVLALLASSLLLSLFGQHDRSPTTLAASVQHCYVDYWRESALVEHLRRHLPDELADRVRFRSAQQASADVGGTLVYPQATGAIQLRPLPAAPDSPGFLVWFWRPGANESVLAPYEAWFWRETFQFYHNLQEESSRSEDVSFQPEVSARREMSAARHDTLPTIEVLRSELKGGLDPRSGLATALVLFGLFFVCVYLLPSLTCEERECGVLLAQALSPASTREILTAKFLFYSAIGLVLAVAIAGTYRPVVLARPFFWLALVVAVTGSMGIGLTIASLARTQRSASMGAMGYTLIVALFLWICQQNNIPALPCLVLEYHCPRMLHAALTDTVLWYHWLHLAGAAVLAVTWCVAAAILFRKYGWR